MNLKFPSRRDAVENCERINKNQNEIIINWQQRSGKLVAGSSPMIFDL